MEFFVSEHKRSIERATRRAFRVRQKIKKVAHAPRVSIFRSLNQTYAQLIDDAQGKTLASASTLTVKEVSGDKKTLARAVGKALATQAKNLNINTVVFDRGSYRYHGRVREVAEGLREGGLTL
jgi:large subunit ribosomal protein L18